MAYLGFQTASFIFHVVKSHFSHRERGEGGALVLGLSLAIVAMLWRLSSILQVPDSRSPPIRVSQIGKRQSEVGK